MSIPYVPGGPIIADRLERRDTVSQLKTTTGQKVSRVAALNTKIKNLETKWLVNGSWTNSGAKSEHDTLTAQLTLAEIDRADSQKALIIAESAFATPTTSTTQTTASTQKLGTVSGDLEYNVPAVKEAYFKDNMSFFEYNTYNQPSKSVADARDLWTNGISSKGMFQTWTPPNGVVTSDFIDGFDIDNRLGDAKWQKYGFQFLYNPGNIAMSYSGNVDVDVSLMLSGREKFNPVSTKATQSTISFEILLNRMFDMKYFNKNTGLLQSGQDSRELYGSKTPSIKDQREIFHKGTMYDVEFLLKTLFGFEVPSQLGRGKTADMGFVIPRPVELHLGNKLRYLVYVDGFSLNHVIFDTRMVPLFTTLSIRANRVPDYGGELAVDGASRGSGGGGGKYQIR